MGGDTVAKNKTLTRKQYNSLMYKNEIWTSAMTILQCHVKENDYYTHEREKIVFDYEWTLPRKRKTSALPW